MARPTEFEPVTLGLEMQRIGYTNDIVLHRFVILQYLLYNVSMRMAYRLARLSYKTITPIIPIIPPMSSWKKVYGDGVAVKKIK